MSNRREDRGRGRRFDVFHLWATTATGLAALGIGIYSLVALQASPEIDVALPHVVRIAQGKNAWLYLQPTMTAMEPTEDVEVITDAVLRLKTSENAKNRPSFYWDETGAWTVDTKGKLSYRQTADPAPILVAHEKPQQPTMRFNAEGWNFYKARYEGTLAIHRSEGRKPIVKKFCLIITPGNEARFRKFGQFASYLFRNDRPASPGAPRDEIGCYRTSEANSSIPR
ncbi:MULTISPECIES: hypothetical protein [unclassified Streptomyces]|uniref:hypothetical protein n=1 Tax=unclassified Streptomyces TaxID=2593676 RepID=UPI00131C40F9|nr:hypothetical protein [Streptomyces sp. CB01635]